MRNHPHILQQPQAVWCGSQNLSSNQDGFTRPTAQRTQTPSKPDTLWAYRVCCILLWKMKLNYKRFTNTKAVSFNKYGWNPHNAPRGVWELIIKKSFFFFFISNTPFLHTSNRLKIGRAPHQLHGNIFSACLFLCFCLLLLQFPQQSLRRPCWDISAVAYSIAHRKKQIL